MTTRVVDAGVLEQLELLVEIGEQLRRGLGTDHARGMAIEGDDRGRQTAFGGQALDGGDDGAVARDARRRTRRS